MMVMTMLVMLVMMMDGDDSGLFDRVGVRDIIDKQKSFCSVRG